MKNKGLNCIAVTDHNDYRKIDEIKGTKDAFEMRAKKYHFNIKE